MSTSISSGRGGQMAPVQQMQGSHVVKQEQKDAYAGEEKQSVSVNSQIASATLDGARVDAPITSNIDQLIREVGASQSDDVQLRKVESELRQLSTWGNGSITDILQRTKSTEEGLVRDARAKQTLLEEQHKAELTKVVQQLDLKKAAALKELEDELQRNLQRELTKSKEAINAIENQVATRRAGLLQQLSHMGGLSSKLSELVVTANLQPTATRTIIDSNTSTGNVFAVAAGGETTTRVNVTVEQSGGSRVVEAAPVAGQLRTDGVKIDGDLVNHNSHRKVGEGEIAAMKSEVVTGGSSVSSGTVVAEQQRIGGTNQPIAAHGMAGKRIDASYGKK